MNEEYWRDIEGFEGYQVSDLGRVRSRRKPGKLKSGDVNLASDYRMLTGTVMVLRGGYIDFMLTRQLRKYHRKGHVLVLEAFVGKRPSGALGCHNNGDPSDNRLANLRWASPTENSLDRREHGTDSGGERQSPKARKLSLENVNDIRLLRSQGMLQKVIAAQFGVCRGTISAILRGQIWKAEDEQ